MKIGSKLLLWGFIPLASLTGLVAEVLYINSIRINESSQIIREAYQNYSNIMELRKHEKNFQFYREKYHLHQMKDLAGRVAEFVMMRKPLQEDPAVTGQFTILEETLRRYQQMVDDLLASPDPLRPERAIAEMNALGQQMERLSEQMIQRVWIPIHLQTGKALIYSWIFAIWAILTGVFLALYLSQGLVRPIQQLVRSTKKVAEGDLSQRVELRSRDEIGELAQSFNRMVDSLGKGQARLNQQSEELRKTKEALVNIFQSSVDAIVATDHKGYITFANRSMQEMIAGIAEPMNISGIRMSDLYSGGLPEARKIMNILREKGRLVNYETTIVRDDRVIPILTSASLLKDETGAVVGTLGVIKDLTEKKKLEENLKEAQAELVQKEKLAAVGRLAAGVAHELNDPLTSILTFSNLLREETASDDSARESLDIVIKEANRAKRIVYDLLSFSREAKPALQWIDLNDVLNVSLLLLEKQGALAGIEVQLDLAKELPLVRADSGQVHQVFTNTILNGIQAMDAPEAREKNRERKLSLRTRFYAAAEDSLVPPPTLAGPFIRIAIEDTGVGIASENRGKIFEPFFTTKGPGEGTGLGLYIVTNILKTHGAQYRLESQEGEGTLFLIDFPLAGGEKI